MQKRERSTEECKGKERIRKYHSRYAGEDDITVCV